MDYTVISDDIKIHSSATDPGYGLVRTLRAPNGHVLRVRVQRLNTQRTSSAEVDMFSDAAGDSVWRHVLTVHAANWYSFTPDLDLDTADRSQILAALGATADTLSERAVAIVTRPGTVVPVYGNDGRLVAAFTDQAVARTCVNEVNGDFGRQVLRVGRSVPVNPESLDLLSPVLRVDTDVDVMPLILDQPRRREVAVGELIVDETIRPDTDPNGPSVAMLTASYNRDAVGVLSVCERSDGTLVVLDGYTRRHAVRLKEGDSALVVCEVYTGLSLEQETHLHRMINKVDPVGDHDEEDTGL